MAACKEPCQITPIRCQGRHHRSRMGRHPGAQYAAAALVAVAVLRNDRLVDRLLDRLSVLAAGLLLQQRPVPLAYARRRSRAQLAALQQERGPMMAKLASASLQEIESTPELLDFARALGTRAFADNCAPCHGAGGGGAKGYPNLNDNDWLWGGSLDRDRADHSHGVRAGDDDGHQGSMPAFGHDGLLKPDEISTVADYVRSLSGLPTAQGADLTRGAKDLRRQLRGLPRAGRQRQSRGRRAEPDRQDLALWLRQEDHHGRHHQRARRRDAGLGRQAR